ncbi:MAG TPA: CdaR family protein [Oscillospiraceae bacterium]|nr:CdaR family protein [Oscillospiraceae bacterium]HPF55097.1 CdaR family protein [Clostridiales bacterium]HPK34415.1 CdaR family protein [Oscillospiraceae bacterium]HPR75600.1 CdaR family protein [Oscillospiraceae bacterium]
MNKPSERKRRTPNPKNKKPLFPLTRKNGEPVTLASILSNKRILQILSVVAAVFIWAMVSTGAAVQETKTIKNVPIEFDATGSLFQTYGLKVVDSDIDVVDVTVTGPRYVISSLNSSDIKVTAITTDVTTPGNYQMNLRPGFQDSGIDAEVALKSTEPVNAKFDTFTSFELTILPEKEGDISVASGYVLGTVTVSPATVTIEAPSTYVSQISQAVVKYSKKQSDLTNGFITNSDIILLDADDQEITDSSIELSTDTAEISVPILKRKMVNISITLLNAPDGWSKYLSVTPSTIEIAGPENIVDAMTELPVGSIDVSTITDSQEERITLPEIQNILDVNNVGFVTVDIDYSKVKSKTFSVSQIGFSNIGDIDLSGYSVTFATTVLENVTVYASSSDISDVSSDNLRAVVTLDPNSITAGQISLPAKIISTDGTTIWTVGSYTVLVNIMPKS